jgi:hypothetical protein
MVTVGRVLLRWSNFGEVHCQCGGRGTIVESKTQIDPATAKRRIVLDEQKACEHLDKLRELGRPGFGYTPGGQRYPIWVWARGGMLEHRPMLDEGELVTLVANALRGMGAPIPPIAKQNLPRGWPRAETTRRGWLLDPASRRAWIAECGIASGQRGSVAGQSRPATVDESGRFRRGRRR